MELIEKILFVHDSQISRWGRVNAWSCLVAAVVCIFVFSPAVLWAAIYGLDTSLVVIETIRKELDPEQWAFLTDTVALLQGCFAVVSVLLLAVGLSLLGNYLLLQKLVKRARQDAS